MPNEQVSRRGFHGGAHVIEALVFTTMRGDVARFTPAPAEIDPIATARARHVFNPKTHQSRLFQAKSKLFIGTRNLLRNRRKR